MKEFRDPGDVHEPLAMYSHQVELSSDERMLVLAGQIGARADGAIPDDPAEQFEVAWDNVEANLRAAGMAIGDLVKVTIYFVGEMDVVRRREIMERRLGGHRPAMTWVGAASLAMPALRVEIDAWASQAETAEAPHSS